MADLKPRQYKRVGRIAENNPERAIKVAGRMEKRATREDRGKAIVKSTKRGEGTLRGRLMTGSGNNAEQFFRGRGEAMTKQEFDKKKADLRQKASEKMTSRPDTPLADSPVPSFLRGK